MTAESDRLLAEAVLQTIRPEDELKAMLSASLMTVPWSAQIVAGFDSTDPDRNAFLFLYSNQSHLLIPNGGWINAINFHACANDGSLGSGSFTVELCALRDEEEVVLATYAVAAPGLGLEDPGVTRLERIQLLAGDVLHVRCVGGVVTADGTVGVTVTVGLGLFR